MKYKATKQRPDETITAKSNTQQNKYKQQTTRNQKVNSTQATSRKDRKQQQISKTTATCKGLKRKDK